ncbi:DUF3096 domain-containing protein [Zhongshania borealis]|uniref:DUF3096 domain-containing protein n=1 Tax=Zhongshania borealis TaxID=889488 RepID=A0ABP7X6P5_9GAMM
MQRSCYFSRGHWVKKWFLTQQHHSEHIMTITLDIIPIISIAAGAAILVKPRLLNYIVAGYLIAIGLIDLLNLHI